MQRYETVFILTPVLSDDQAKETVKKFKEILTNGGAKIVHEENWGLKKLAYSIQKKTTGFYYLIEFESETPLIAELDLQYRREERVLRYLTINMEKHHVKFAESRRAKKETVPTN